MRKGMKPSTAAPPSTIRGPGIPKMTDSGTAGSAGAAGGGAGVSVSAAIGSGGGASSVHIMRSVSGVAAVRMACGVTARWIWKPHVEESRRSARSVRSGDIWNIFVAAARTREERARVRPTPMRIISLGRRCELPAAPASTRATPCTTRPPAPARASSSKSHSPQQTCRSCCERTPCGANLRRARQPRRARRPACYSFSMAAAKRTKRAAACNSLYNQYRPPCAAALVIFVFVTRD